ncbi:MAG TPA: hypothetical protein PK490_06195 [Prosthecobacter sp.]|nr:hypothetical protein [Prosthecobacter sp.]
MRQVIQQAMKLTLSRVLLLLVATVLFGVFTPNHQSLFAAGPPNKEPGKVPPDAAKGRQLAEFIKQAKARGLKGSELARAIAEERKRLGMPPEDD